MRAAPLSADDSPFIPKSKIADTTKVGLHFSINGKVKQSGTTADMIFDVPSLISFVSGIMKLEVRPVLEKDADRGRREIYC